MNENEISDILRLKKSFMMNTSLLILKDNISEINVFIIWLLNENEVSNIFKLEELFMNKNYKSHQVSDTLSVSTSVAEKLRESFMNKNSDEFKDKKNIKNKEKMNLLADEKKMNLLTNKKKMKLIKNQYAFLNWKDW